MSNLKATLFTVRAGVEVQMSDTLFEAVDELLTELNGECETVTDKTYEFTFLNDEVTRTFVRRAKALGADVELETR